MKEKFGVGYNPDSSLFLYVYNDKNQLLGQENFEHPPFKYYVGEPSMSVDVNQDGVDELILFTRNAESLFLNVFDYRNMKVLVESRFVTELGGLNAKQDYNIDALGTFDVNGDLVPELFFMIKAGFALNPRRLFRYDFVHDTIISSINTGAAFMPGEGSEVDGRFQILLSASALGNMPPDYPAPYHDSCGWIFGFDQDLQLLFDPVSVGSYPFHFSPLRVIRDKGYCIAASNNTVESLYRLLIVNMNGTVEEGAIISDGNFRRINHIYWKGESVYYLLDHGLDYVYFLEQDILKTSPSRLGRKLAGRYLLLNEDLDMDGGEELLMLRVQNFVAEFYVGANLTNKIEMPLNQRTYGLASASYHPKDKSIEIIFNALDGSESFRITRNPRFKLRYLVWFAIYAVSVAFVMGIMYLQRRRIEQRHALENQVANLQLQNLRNQLDPHFTFNALNSVGNAIYQENKEKAYDLFHRFTRMIRSSLMFSNEVFRPLDEEIQFTKDYLEFQLTRFRDLFEFSFTIEPKLDLVNTQIPKLMIQGFAENAVKHAFYGIDYKGQIHVSISHSDTGIQITIEDNGIGIKRSKELGATSGTQKGEQLILEQIKQINKLYGRNIEILVSENNQHSSQEPGTIIKISLN